MEISIGDKKVKAEASVFTLVVYEQEFGGDLIKDLFGRANLNDIEQDDNYIDFTLNNWNALTKVLWAMCKTADSSTPRYQEWAKSVSGVDLFAMNEEVAQEVVDAFFRPATSTKRKS